MNQSNRVPRTTRRRLWSCIITLAGVLLLTLPTLAAPANTTIYLPLVTKPGGTSQPSQPTSQPTPQPTSQPPQPTPQPTPQPASAGFFAMRKYRTYNAATAVDVNGGVHLAFYQSDEGHDSDALGQVAYYAYCPGPVATCNDGSKWTAVQFATTGVVEVQIVLTKNGHPRLLIRRNGQNGYDYEYWACEEQCLTPSQWSGLRVNSAAGADLHNADQPQHSFALDSQDRPRFIWSNGSGNGRLTGIYYARCDAADCTQPGSWTQAIVENLETKTVTADNTTLVFDGDKPRVLTRVNYSGLPVRVDYIECNLNCDYDYNWWDNTIANPDGKMWESWDLMLDKDGHPRVALYEAADPNITVGGKLFYGWCDDGGPIDGRPQCYDADPRFQLVQVASGEGKNVDMAIDAAGRTHMVYDAGERGTIGELWCDASCTSADTWQRRILETSAQLMQEFAPASPLSCDQEQQDRMWLDAIPQIIFDRDGRLVVAYDTTNYARCYSIDPAHPNDPVYSRVEQIWWAVRWATFAQQ